MGKIYISTIHKDLVARWVDTINKNPVNYCYLYISSEQTPATMWDIKINYNNLNCIWFCKNVNMSIECNFCSFIELWKVLPEVHVVWSAIKHWLVALPWHNMRIIAHTNWTKQDDCRNINMNSGTSCYWYTLHWNAWKIQKCYNFGNWSVFFLFIAVKYLPLNVEDILDIYINF